MNLPFKLESRQLVICKQVFEHLEKLEQCLNELLRVSGSFILLRVPDDLYFRITNLLRWETC
jgi:hypothetical protein